MSARKPLSGAERQRRYAARHPDRIAERNARRVWCGRLYVGMTRTSKTAATLNEAVRKELHGREDKSRA